MPSWAIALITTVIPLIESLIAMLGAQHPAAPALQSAVANLNSAMGKAVA